MQYFGDSYDVVKRFLLKIIAPEAPWAAFPMFTHPFSPSEVEMFERFLGVSVVSNEPMEKDTDRAKHFVALANHKHVFLDPDTGIRLKPSRDKNMSKYVFGPEIESLCQAEPSRLLVVFDQSVPRGSEAQHIKAKLAHFAERGLSCFAYRSHACFVVLSSSSDRCQHARQQLLSSGLPVERLA